MFSSAERQLISHLLELFAEASEIPIAIYETDGTDGVSEIASAHADMFPEHCRTLWTLEGGRKKCSQDMWKRAKEGFETDQPTTHTCHAGLTTEIHPLVINGTVRAVLQYGAYRKSEDADTEKTARIKRHERAMNALGANKQQAEQIRSLLLSPELVRTPEQRALLKEKIPPILARIVQWYLDSREDQKYIQDAAFHDVQLRLQGALAHAEDLLMEMRGASGVPKLLLESAENLMGSVEATGMVLLNVLRGKYLPKDYRFKPLDLRETISKAVSLCRPLAVQKGVAFVEELNPEYSRIMLQVSDLHIQQAFNNLIHNAVKYSYSSQNYGGRYVAIRGGYADKGYRVTISNFGVGIEPDEHEVIFREGKKGRLQQAEYRTGSGQGLSLTKQIVEVHRGNINVQSAPVDDSKEEPRPYITRFTVWLPLTQREPTQAISPRS